MDTPQQEQSDSKQQSQEQNLDSSNQMQTPSDSHDELGGKIDAAQKEQIKSEQQQDLFSNKRWGTTPIRQDTPWELPPSPTQTQPQPIQQLPSSAVTALAGNSSRFDQPWRPIVASANNPQPSLASSASFANHSLINPAPGALQKSFLAGGNGQQAFSGSSAIGSGFQTQSDFARAPGPVTSSILDAKPFGGIGQRASTWSSFGAPPGSNDIDSEWPKQTNSGISGGQQTSNAFDLVPEFEPGKSWHGSNLMKGLDDDSPLSNLGTATMSNAFQNPYGFSATSGAPKSPTGSQYETSGIGTWSPIVKNNRSGSMWDGDGSDGRGEGGRFDDGTAIWGNPTSTKATGAEWGDKGGDSNNLNDKSRPTGANSQSNYRPHPQQQQQSSSTAPSSASLLMSSNTSPSGHHGRNPNTAMNKAPSHSFEQVQQQSNALSSQANQPNRGLGISPNVPSKHQQYLTTMAQQIQLAVQAGHLNPQILNQPLAPVTLQLLFQLLNQIKSLQQLQMKFNQPGNHQATVSVQMTKTKQNIMNLQNQIVAQQAMHLKQQQTQATHNISTRQPTLPNLAAGGVGSGNLGPTLPPGISQSGDSFRTGTTSVGDFHSNQAIVNSFGVDSMNAIGLASSLSHMSLGGSSGSGQGGMMHASRFDQPWRATASNKPHHQAMGAASSSFANHNLMNTVPSGMQKSMLNSGNCNSSFGMQQSGEFARAPGPASSMMDNNLTPKPAFGMTSTSASRTSSTWTAFGSSSANESESEWPKSTTATGGISSNSTASGQQSSNVFDLVPEFEPGKPWRGSMLMKSVEDDPTMTPASMARSLAPQRKIWSDEIL